MESYLQSKEDKRYTMNVKIKRSGILKEKGRVPVKIQGIQTLRLVK